jgi:xanthine dehydrogenase small subunit
MMISFLLNRERVDVDAASTEIALDILRNRLHQTSVKEGCREGDCGACTVLLGTLTGKSVQYQALASCLLPAAALHGGHVVTLEGLCGADLNPIQAAFLEQGAVQCGFCTPGILLSLTAWLLSASKLDPEEASAAISGHICRCTGYVSIRRAVESLVAGLGEQGQGLRLEELVDRGIVPAYFLEVQGMLSRLPPRHSEPTDPGRPALVIAGGTDLFVHPRGDISDKTPVFTDALPGAQGIVESGNFLELGAAVSVEALRQSPLVRKTWPGLPGQLLLVSSPQIRNRATLAGNIVNASPIGDLTIILLALEAELVLTGPDGERSLPLHDFFLGYKKMDLGPGELIRLIRLPLPQGDVFFNFEKVSRRRHLDIAGVNSALQLSLDQGRVNRVALSAGGVAPIPLRLEKTAAYLCHRPLCDETLAGALGVMDGEIAPISDVRGSAAYKRRTLRHLLVAHFAGLFPEHFCRDAASLQALLGSCDLEKGR